MDSALLVHRLHFAFTVTFHYLFPQLTMGLAPLIVVLKTLALRSADKAKAEIYNQAARFWARIFGINFVLGVVTGIPMEFQFGTNWSHFSRFAGGVIGQTLAMEGMFAFFLESAFLGLFLYGEKRLEPARSLVVGGRSFPRLVALGILHHRHRRLDAASRRLRARCRWLRPAHQFLGVRAESLGLVAIRSQHERRRDHRRFRHGVRRRVLPAVGQIPRARRKVLSKLGSWLAAYSASFSCFPPAMARAEWWPAISRRRWPPWKRSSTASPARPLVLIGQPDVAQRKIDNPVVIPQMLSFLTYRRWKAAGARS